MRPFWSEVLRALREARGATQEGWAALLGVSRKTVQRWEQAAAVPDPVAEAALADLCRARGLFRTYDQGPLRGVTLTPDLLRDLLAEARIGTGPATANGDAPPAENPAGRAFPLTGGAGPGAAPPVAVPATGRLTARPSDGRAAVYPLDSGETTIGRGTDNRIVIPSEHVSRYHARVIRTEQGYAVEDLGSKNGTSVGGEPVRGRRPLRDGEVLIFAGLGEYALTFTAGDSTVTVAREALPAGGLWVDTRSGEAWLRGRPLALSPPSFRLLAALYGRAGETVDFATLARLALAEVQGDAVAAVERLAGELAAALASGGAGWEVVRREPDGFRLALT